MLSHPSPHHNARKGPIRLIVLHASAGKSDKGDVSWIQSPESKVSYHTLIGRDGERYTMVDPSRRAWHAGVAKWKDITDVNGASVGVSWCNRHDGTEMLTAAQIAEMRVVLKELVRRYPTIEAIVTHMQVAPSRKTDPHKIPNFYAADWEIEDFR